MVVTSQLRIGNKVKEAVLGICNVEEINANTISVSSGKYQPLYPIYFTNIDPIPLSSKILLGCGFKYDANNDNYKFKDYYYVPIEHTFWLYRKHIKGNDMELKCVNIADIEYLHELQNIIQLLTGDELKITI